MRKHNFVELFPINIFNFWKPCRYAFFSLRTSCARSMKNPQPLRARQRCSRTLCYDEEGSAKRSGQRVPVHLGRRPWLQVVDDRQHPTCGGFEKFHKSARHTVLFRWLPMTSCRIRTSKHCFLGSVGTNSLNGLNSVAISTWETKASFEHFWNRSNIILA